MDKQSRTGPTPGPWRWVADDAGPENEWGGREPGPIDITSFQPQGYIHNPRIEGANGQEVIGCGEYFILSGATKEEQAANGLLLAAAPELLAFVEDVEDYLVCMGYDPETADPESTGVQHVLTARALLVKVRP